jgi:ATP-dependent RNA helicase RhlB
LSTPAHLSDVPFTRLSLRPELQRNLADAGFSQCTPIQAEALPLLLAGRNVAGQAQTGTGKTITFLLALYQRLLEQPAPPERKPTQVRALVLAPTRELVIQIHQDAQVIGHGIDLSLALAYGGVDYEKQRSAIAAGVDILVGTPGRLIDYHRQGVYDLRAVQALVLDEADRMFDLGFIKDLRFLLRRCSAPERRLNMLFSATLSHRVLELAYEHMGEPQLVRVEPEKVTVDQVRQVIYHVANEEKIPLLLGLLRRLEPPRALVFVNTKGGAERVWSHLAGNGVSAGLMTGDVRQTTRQRLIGQLKRGEIQALIATDVAARGLHIDGVTHVFNFDLPQDAEDYVHRIGRTARAGAAGEAISFGCESHVYSLPEIEAYIGKPIPTAPVDAGVIATGLAPPAQIDEPGVLEARARRRAAAAPRGRGHLRGRPPGGGASAAAKESPPAAETSAGEGTRSRRRRRRRRGGAESGVAVPSSVPAASP